MVAKIDGAREPGHDLSEGDGAGEVGGRQHRNRARTSVARHRDPSVDPKITSDEVLNDSGQLAFQVTFDDPTVPGGRRIAIYRATPVSSA
jgi:hypothetical protein